MKKRFISALAFISLLGGGLPGYAQSKSMLEDFQFESLNFTGQISVESMQQLRAKFAKMQAKRGNELLTLPVVVHIIHNGTIGNISDEQVAKGIEFINEAFGSNGGNSTETHIQFALATKDPNGVATTGITRTESSLTDMNMDTDDAAVKALVQWNPKEYINIWLVKEVRDNQTTAVAGYAYFPSALTAAPQKDGIVMEAGYFGTTKQNTSVLVHEMGHYLGLFHTFEGTYMPTTKTVVYCQNDDCTVDGDGICDTPPQYNDGSSSYYSCETGNNTCHSDATPQSNPKAINPFTSDMADDKGNFMDYSNVACYKSFTAGQTTRMRGTLEQLRSGLLTSKAIARCKNPITFNVAWPTSPVEAGKTLTIEATASGATSAQWLVNGELKGNEFNLQYTPQTGGSYTFVLQAGNNDKACSDKVEKTITAICPVVAKFNASALKTTPDVALNMINKSSNATAFTWFVNNKPMNQSSDFSFVSSHPGLYEIGMTASNGYCESVASSVLVTVAAAIQPQTGFPVWPMMPQKTNQATLVDFKGTSPVLSTFSKGIAGSEANIGVGKASPAFNSCGEIQLFAMHDGSVNQNSIYLYDNAGNRLSPLGLDGMPNCEMQVVRVPGMSNDWYIIYKRWTNKIMSGVPDWCTAGYTPSNWAYSQVHYSGANDFSIVKKDIALTAANGVSTVYTCAAAVSRTASGNTNAHYLFLTERVALQSELAVHRFLINANGINFDAATNKIACGWDNVCCTMISTELSSDESILALTNRSYSNGQEDLVFVNCENFGSEIRAFALEKQLLQKGGQWVAASTVAADHFGLSAAYCEFSPNSRFLYLCSGGNKGNNYFTQVDLDVNQDGSVDFAEIFNSTTLLRMRTRMCATVSGLYDISTAYNGQMYFTKLYTNDAKKFNTLYVLPADTANTFLTQNLAAADIDFSSTTHSNIQIPLGAGMSELPDQIDGYNYMDQNAIDVQVAIKPTDCAGNCISKAFEVEVFETESGKIINTFTAKDCTSKIHFCANYYTHYSIREKLTGKVFSNAIINSQVVYPADKSAFEFVVEIACGAVCHPDAAIGAITQSCNGSEVTLTVEVSNPGTTALPASMPLSVYRGSATETSLLGSTSLGTEIAPGTTSLITITVPKENSIEYAVQINDNKAGSFADVMFNECDTMNNKTNIQLNYPVLKLELGNDFSLCPGEARALTATHGFASYLWLSDFSNKPFISIEKTGTYTVEAIDECGIKQTDAVTVTVDTETLTINDAAICSNDAAITVIAKEITPLSGVTPLSNATGFSILPAQSTTYIAKQISKAGCELYDEFTVTVNQPQPNIIDDKTICSSRGEVASFKVGELTAIAITPSSGVTLANGEYQFTTSTKELYTITARDKNNCAVRDQFIVRNECLCTVEAKTDKTPICKGTAAQLTTLTYDCGKEEVSLCSVPEKLQIAESSVTRTIAGSQNASVAKGETVAVATGKEFNGNIDINGGTLIVYGSAKPMNVNFNSGSIIIAGVAQFSNLNMNNTSSQLINYGESTFGSITFNGKIINHNKLTVLYDFNLNSTSASFVNTASFIAKQSVNNNSIIDNGGTITIANSLRNNANGTIRNNCTINISGELHNNNIFDNKGTVSVGTITYLNSGLLTMNAGSVIKTRDLMINSRIKGNTATCSKIEVSNRTTVNGGAAFEGLVSVCDANGIETENVKTPKDCNCTASGTTSGWAYEWTPSTGLSNTAISNPVASPSVSTEYTVKVINSAGVLGSAKVLVDVQNCASEARVEVSPNPFTDHIVVKVSTEIEETASVTVTTISGVMVYQGEIQTKQEKVIPLSVVAGQYMLVVKTKTFEEHLPIVKDGSH